jgi:magnesium-transporting ATPase (P-type)
MLRSRKPVPIAFMILSLLYFFYVIGSGSSRMIGDEIGGDPGTMVLPLVLSVFMFLVSTFLFLTDKPQSESRSSELGRDDLQLLVLTFIISIVYILMMRTLGFIICTVILLYTLVFFYQRHGIRKNDLSVWFVGVIVSTLMTLGVYSIGRTITRFLFRISRENSNLAWIGSRSFTLFVVLSVVIVVFVVILFVSRSFFRENRAGDTINSAWIACMVSVASTELLYIVFRQAFFVQLAQGLVAW